MDKTKTNIDLNDLNKIVDKMLPALGVDTRDPLIRMRARIIARKSLKSYDSSKSQLKTYLYHRLLPLKREQLKRQQIIRFPERDAQMLGNIEEYKHKYLELKGTEATEDEVIDHFGLPLKKYNKLMRYKTMSTSPDSEQVGSQQGKTREDVLADYLYHDMGNTDRTIYKHKTGYTGAKVLSNTELAMKLKMSPSAVTQRAKSISDKLQAAITPEDYDPLTDTDWGFE